MKEIKNVSIWQCEYCNKKMMYKSSCARHEKRYCHDSKSEHVLNCNHEFDEDFLSGYDYVCIHCLTRVNEGSELL